VDIHSQRNLRLIPATELSVRSIAREARMNRHRFSPLATDAFQREFHLDEATTKMLLNASLNSQNDIIILAIDREYRYYFFNERHRTAMKTFYGTDVEIGMNILDAVTSEIDRVHSKINYGKAMDGTPHSTIQEFGDKNISVFESFYSPLYNDAGEIVGATAYARDVTERILAERKLKASEEENRLLIEAMNQGIANHDVIWDEHGKPVDYRYVYVNENYERMTGLKRENILGRLVSEVLPQTEAYWWEAFAEVALTRQPKRVVNHSAELDRTYSISFYSPKPNQVSGIVDDITSLIAIQQQLIDSELRYQLLAEQSLTVVWELDPQGVFRYISPVVEKLLGYKPEELIATKHVDDLARLDEEQVRGDLPIALDLNSTRPIERALVRKDHSRIWVETYIAKITDASGQVVKYRGSDKDITERKHREAEILFANTHDHLTRLFNRRHFDQSLIDMDRPHNYPLSLIMGDLNGLKLINDAFGHAVGDTMLIDVASILRDQFGSQGMVARLGGDEFGVLLPTTDLPTARR
jgi:PAS domain S-box-containing protein